MLLRNKLLMVAIALSLSACASMDQAPVVQAKTVTVEVPVPVVCKTPTPPPPDYCFSTLQQSDDLFTKVRCLLADRQASLAYELELLTAFNSCK